MKLADYLTANGISQAEFAQIIGATQVSVSRYVCGQRVPRRDVMVKIKEATGGHVTANDFMQPCEAAE